MMHRQSYPRFLQSEMFHAVLQTTYAYNPNSPNPPQHTSPTKSTKLPQKTPSTTPNSKSTKSNSKQPSASPLTPQLNTTKTTKTTTESTGKQISTEKTSHQNKQQQLTNDKKKITQLLNIENAPTNRLGNNKAHQTIDQGQNRKDPRNPPSNTTTPKTRTKALNQKDQEGPRKRPGSAAPALFMLGEQDKHLDRHNSMPSSQKSPNELQKLKMENKLAARNSTHI